MKKVMSMMLVMLMVLSSMTMVFADSGDILLIAPAPAKAPEDVVGTTYEEAVKALMNGGVVSGYGDGTFRPDKTVTRAEACAFLVNYLAPTEEERNAAADSGFTDVSGWATTFVNYAVEKGIVKGYTDGTFRPGNQVNYQEMATMTVNALGIKAEELEGPWPDCYINKAKELGMYENISVVKGNKDQANRGDVAEMIYSLIKYKDQPILGTLSERLVKSNEAFAEVKSMSYEMAMDMAMSMGAESVDTKSVMKMDMVMDPLTMYMTADMESAGEQQKIEYYYVTEGNEMIMYMLMEGQWYKMSMGDIMTAAIPENPMEDMDIYLNAYDHLRVEGKESIGGRSSTKIYCELGDEYMEEMMSQMGSVTDMMEGFGEELTAFYAETLQVMKGFGYEMWIDDETNQLVKIRMDMKDLMKEILDAIMDMALETAIAENPDLTAEEIAALKAEVGQIKVDKMTMEMVLTNINKIEEIQLPKELKTAIDLGSATGADQVTE